MRISALSSLSVPSLVLFTFLTSASVKALSSRCEQDDDSFSLMQAEKSWMDVVGSDTFIGTGAKGASNHGQQIPNTAAKALAEARAPLLGQERRQSMVQRKLTFTLNNHHRATTVLLPLFAALLVLSAIFCVVVGYQYVSRGQSEVNSMGPRIDRDALSVSTTSLLGATSKNRGDMSPKNANNKQMSPMDSPNVRRQLSPLTPVATPQVDSQRQLTPVRPLNRTTPRSGFLSSLVPGLVSQSEETRLGIHHPSLGDADEHAALDIIATTGQPFLRMSIAPHQTTGYRLVLESVPNSQRACIIESPATSDVTTPYLILDGHGGEHGYFRLVAAGKPAFEVVIGGVSCFEITGSSEVLKYQVVDKINQTTRVVAMAQISHNDFPGGEHLEFRVLPGTDAVLIIGIILGITVFGNN